MTRTFEETYPKAPFAELIRLSVALAQWIARHRAEHGNGALPAGTALSH